MVAPERESLSLGLSGLAGVKRFSPAPYKHLPVYPLLSPAVNFSYSNQPRLHGPCEACFPQPQPIYHQNYVDLLDFSRFGGIPYPVLPGAQPPSPWFADLRYTFKTPLPHSYPNVYDEVIKSDRVDSAIEVEEIRTPDVSVYKIKRKVKKFYYEIRATLSRFICKICGYVLYKVFRRLMTRLLVCPQQMEQLVAAEKTGIPLVYLPLHRSHLDYLLITWASWHFGLRLPHIASGDNLNLSGLGWLLRATGAFFIHRRVDEHDETGKDAIYRAVLHSYIEQVLKKGMCIEFFLEGTRSRFGKPLLPKHGLISNVVTAVQEKVIPDCYLVPVSYTYDNVAEGVFLDELMGIPKKRESVIGVITGIFRSFGKPKRCGVVRMHYGTPIILSDYLDALHEALVSREIKPQLGRLPHCFSYRELVPWQSRHKEEADYRSLIRAIGYHVVYEAQSMVSISLVTVVSALLMCKFRQGVTLQVLSADTQWLCDQIIHDGSDVMGWHSGETHGRIAVEYALQYTRKSVERHVDSDTGTDDIHLINTHRQLVNMAFYKNSLLPLFALKSAIGLVLSAQNPPRIDFADVVNDVAFICEWMQFEVMFCKPCEDLRAVIVEVLGRNGLSHIDSGILRLVCDEEDDFDEAAHLKLEVRDAMSRELLLFYSNFLRPFLQSLYIVITKLLAGDSVVEESKTIKEWCKNCIINPTLLPFPLLLEAVNSDSFRNCIRLLRYKDILSSDSTHLEAAKSEEIRRRLLRFLAIQ